MRKLTEYQKEILREYGEKWLKWHDKAFEAERAKNEKAHAYALIQYRENRAVVKALARLLQVDCSLTDFRFIVSSKEGGELFSWGI